MLHKQRLLQLIRATKKFENCELSPTASKLNAKYGRRLQELINEVVADVCDWREQLNNYMIALSTQYMFLKLRNENLKRALSNERKCRNRKRSASLDSSAESEGGAIFISPQKIQQARDLQLQQDEETEEKEVRESDEKHQQPLPKASTELEMLQRARIRQEKREQRQQGTEEKQRLKLPSSSFKRTFYFVQDPPRSH